MADVELTAAQTRELMGLDATVQELTTLLTRAERAGVDVAGLQQRLGEANAKRQGLIREFGAGTTARRQR